MRYLKVLIFKKILGGLNKAILSDEIALVPREDGFYIAYRKDGEVVESKIYDERHKDELKNL